MKVYFPNLNGLRAVAAFLVIIHHVEQVCNWFNIPNYMTNVVVTIIGKLGVILFFVISGFLITYLLLAEEEISPINIKTFYVRRILRIWPLYYLIIVLTFFVIPFFDIFSIPRWDNGVFWDNIVAKLALLIFFLPNLVLEVFGTIPYVAQTWSIGAEEQFYLLWPTLNKKIRRKWLLVFGVIFVYLLIKFVTPHLFLGQKGYSTFYGFWVSFPVDCMAIGGMFALIAKQQTPLVQMIRKYLLNKWLHLGTIIITIALISSGFYFPRFHYEFYSVLFGIIILNFSINKDLFFSLENNVFDYLGKISYGMYMFHMIAIVLTIKILLSLNAFDRFLLYPICFVLTIAMSSLSYHFFEKKFLAMKAKYSKIVSGDDAKSES